jgi:hypothetical protein
MSTAATSTGSSTAPAAIGASTQAPAPTVAAPATAPASNLPAPTAPAKKSYTPRSGFPTTVTGPSGLSQMLSAVSDMTFSANTALRIPNYVVPNTTLLYQTLGLCDTQMSHTKRFTDANPDWHPFVSQLYLGVLIFYHTLKTQSTGNQISQEQRMFLEFLDNEFNISHTKIPGPLVPFFQALAACSGPNDHYGNVTFGIPSNLNATQANFYLAQNRLNAVLPSIIMILDQFMRLINRFSPVGAAPAQLTHAITDSHYLDIFGVNAVAGAVNEVAMKTPNARVEINISYAAMQGFFGTTNLWRSCLPFSVATNQSQYVNGANQNVLAFDQFLGFRGATNATVNNTYGWFREVGRIMQPYSDFFRDSVSLGAINTSGIGSIYIESVFTDVPNNANLLTAAPAVRDVRYQAPGTMRYTIEALTDLEISYRTRETGLDLIAEQMGLLTAYVTYWDVNNAVASVYPGPMTGNVIQGPIFDRPIEYLTRPLQPLRYYANLISGYYHTPTAGKFGN